MKIKLAAIAVAAISATSFGQGWHLRYMGDIGGEPVMMWEAPTQAEKKVPGELFALPENWTLLYVVPKPEGTWLVCQAPFGTVCIGPIPQAK
jgi:hypothetical protein